MSPFDELVEQNEAIAVIMFGIIEDAFEVVEFALEVAEAAFDSFGDVDFAEDGLIEVGAKFSGGHEAPDLC